MPRQPPPLCARRRPRRHLRNGDARRAQDPSPRSLATAIPPSPQPLRRLHQVFDTFISSNAAKYLLAGVRYQPIGQRKYGTLTRVRYYV